MKINVFKFAVWQSSKKGIEKEGAAQYEEKLVVDGSFKDIMKAALKHANAKSAKKTD